MSYDYIVFSIDPPYVFLPELRKDTKFNRQNSLDQGLKRII